MSQQEIALQCLNILDIYKPYVQKFKETGIPTFFERGCGYYVDQEEHIWNKAKEIQEKFGCLVYAITHEFFEFGTCWSMLCIPSDIEEAEECVFSTNLANNTYYAFAYVYNEDSPALSEFGDVVVQSIIGGLQRVC